MSIYDTLNAEQREAVFHTEDRFLYWQEPDLGKQGC